MPSTLLLADDSLTIQRVIELTFADEDVQVVAVSDGDQAIERAELSPPDIVLADIGMPGRNGYEVARYIKQSPRLSHIPVVLLTGAFEPVDEVRAAEVGCDGVLAKPFEPQLVISRVKALLNERPRILQATDRPASDTSALPLADRQLTGVQAAPLDDYFDRLDAAFANMAKQSATVPGLDLPMSYSPSPRPVVEPPRMPSRAVAALTSEPFTPAAVPISKAQESDTPLPGRAASAPGPAAPPPGVPAVSVPAAPSASLHAVPAALSAGPAEAAPSTVSGLAAPTTVPVPATAAAVPATAAAVRATPAPERAQPLPAITEAFAALLAAEHTDGPPSSRPVWPEWRTPGFAGSEVTDELVEAVARRVLDQLSDRVVREKVSEIVSSVAERLVREEIERLKSSIK